MTQPENQPAQPVQLAKPGYPPMSPAPVGGYAGDGYAVPAGMYRDEKSGVVLPNGVVVASVGRRIGAFFLMYLLAVVTLGIGFVIWGLFLWPRGQGPAFSVLGLRAWRPDDNRPAGFWWMALREIVGRIADGILSFISLLVSFVLFATGREHKALHDYVAGTVVVYDPGKVLGR